MYSVNSKQYQKGTKWSQRSCYELIYQQNYYDSSIYLPDSLFQSKRKSRHPPFLFPDGRSNIHTWMLAWFCPLPTVLSCACLKKIRDLSLTWVEQTQKKTSLHKSSPEYLQDIVHGYKDLSSMEVLISVFSYLISSYKLSNSISVRAGSKNLCQSLQGNPSLADIGVRNLLSFTFPHWPLALLWFLHSQNLTYHTKPTLYKPKTS